MPDLIDVHASVRRFESFDSVALVLVLFGVGCCYFYFVGAPCGEVCEGVLCGPWVGLCFVMGGVCAYLVY